MKPAPTPPVPAPATVLAEAQRHRRIRRRSMARAFVAGVLLHTLAIGWIWVTWEAGLRGGLLVWIDLPASLLYLGRASRELFAWSLVAGGLQWGVWGALLAGGLAYVLARRA